MLTRRFQPWKISPNRSGEFHRTRRKKGHGRFLHHIWCEDEEGNEHSHLALQRWTKYRRPKFKRLNLIRCRPEARLGAAFGNVCKGPYQCTPYRPGNRAEFLRGYPALRSPRGNPLCSPAGHRLEAMGYEKFPF